LETGDGMQGMMLIIATIAAMAYGYFVVCKVGTFFDDRLVNIENRECLRIAFSNPMLADSFCGAIKSFKNDNKGVEILVFSEEPGVLLHKLEKRSVDLIVVPTNTIIDDQNLYSMRKVSLNLASVHMEQGNLEIKVMDRTHKYQNLLWQKGQQGRWADLFVNEYLNTEKIIDK